MDQWPRRWLVLASLALVLLVGGADYLTGHEILFSTFYLVAVALAAWGVNAAFAVLVALLSVVAWVIGDLVAGAVYPHAFVPVWNAGIVLAFYLIVIVLLGRLHAMQRGLEERVRRRTIALTEEMAERERLERELLEVGERERRRIGRDLHDGLGQLLTGTALAGQVLRERLAARSIDESKDAARVVGMVEQAIELTRSFARGLDPVEVDGGGLDQGLRELCAKTGGLGPVACTYRVDGPPVVSDSVTATHLYRIAQESITNALKHGHAHEIRVELMGLSGRVRLSVRDDGIGIPDAGARGEGMGLRIMAHRAAVAGGTLTVARAAKGGTCITCEVPNP